MARTKQSAVSATLAARGNTHGDFTENSEIAQQIKDLLRSGSSYEQMPPFMREAADMIAHKLARAVSGDPTHADHWHDIQGYAQLVEERL